MSVEKDEIFWSSTAVFRKLPDSFINTSRAEPCGHDNCRPVRGVDLSRSQWKPMKRISFNQSQTNLDSVTSS